MSSHYASIIRQVNCSLAALGLSKPVRMAIVDIREELALAWLDPIRKASAAVYGGRVPEGEVRS